jgi:SAM-dependent methyltransferase
LKLWFDRNQDVVAHVADVLHFAPEYVVRSFLRAKFNGYKGADIKAGRAELMLNIEHIDLPDRCIDLIVCSHVLEHVDDRKALSEMFRVLRPKGLALMMTPIIEGWRETYENNAVRTPQERMLHFGQGDHVRYFGADLRQRIEAAGFRSDEFVAVEPDVSRYGLLRGETVFVGRRF